jgi:MIF4G domain
VSVALSLPRAALRQVNDPKPEDVECLAKLMRTIGQELDNSRVQGAKERLTIYFGRIDQLSRSEKLESRIRFMLKVLTCGGASRRPPPPRHRHLVPFGCSAVSLV